MHAHPQTRAATLTMLGLVLGVLAFAQAGAAQGGSGYFVTTMQRGIISCAIGGVPAPNPCPGLLFPDRRTFTFDVPAGSREAVVELRWTVNSAVGARQLALTTPSTLDGGGWAYAEGPSILRVEVPAEQGATTAPGSATVRVGASHQPALVLQQTFELAFTVFVDMDAPADYSAFP